VTIVALWARWSRCRPAPGALRRWPPRGEDDQAITRARAREDLEDHAVLLIRGCQARRRAAVVTGGRPRVINRSKW
jgi:hypothetical protein